MRTEVNTITMALVLQINRYTFVSVDVGKRKAGEGMGTFQ
jgi:hypothetical protein